MIIYETIEAVSPPLDYYVPRYVGWRPKGEWHPAFAFRRSDSMVGVLACMWDGTQLLTGEFMPWPENRGRDMPLGNGRYVLDPPYIAGDRSLIRHARIYSVTATGGILAQDMIPSSVPGGHYLTSLCWVTLESDYCAVLSLPVSGSGGRLHQFRIDDGVPTEIGHTDLPLTNIPVQWDTEDGGVTNPYGAVLLWPRRNIGDGSGLYKTYECDLSQVPLTFTAKADMTVPNPDYPGIPSIRNWRTNGDTAGLRVYPGSFSGREHTATGRGFIRPTMEGGYEAWSYNGSDYDPEPIQPPAPSPQFGLHGWDFIVVGGRTRAFLGRGEVLNPETYDTELLEYWYPLYDPQWSVAFDLTGTNEIGIKNFRPLPWCEVEPGLYIAQGYDDPDSPEGLSGTFYRLGLPKASITGDLVSERRRFGDSKAGAE